MFDDDESDEELEEFIQSNHSAKLSKRELNNAKARIRGAINREAKASKKRSEDMASYIINYAEQRALMMTSRHQEKARKAHGVAISISQLSASVLSSLDVRVPVEISKDRYSPIASANTDFKKINIGINFDNYDAENRERLASLIHMTKGLVYHEGGHIKWTTPFKNLLELSGRADIPAADKFRLIKAWNVLEDQRMETAMCSVSPVMGKYFTSIVLNVVLNLSDLGSNWPWIVGRTYLPSDIRQMVRDAAEQRDVHGIVDDMTRCVMGYRRSKDPREMMHYVIEFSRYLNLWGANPTGPDKHDWDYSYSDDPVPQPDCIPDVQDQPVETPSKGVAKPTSEDKPEDVTTPNEIETDESGDTGSGAHSSDTKTIPDIEDQRKQEEALRNRIDQETKENLNTINDSEIDNFVASVNEHASKQILTDPTIDRMNDNEIKQTTEVARSMISVLERLVVQVEPTWKSHMEEGVLDPTLFRLRDPGDTNFWSGLDGVGSNGHDIALSVLIDSSGSMGNDMDQASISALGIRKACDQLGIPCTITTFNDDVYMMADATEEVDYIRVSATGGTSVVNAMMALEDQRHGKTFHLVIILTDGEWSDVTDVRLWSHPTRSINIVGFGSYMGQHISNKGADHYLVIDDLKELPNIVTDSLIQHFV